MELAHIFGEYGEAYRSTHTLCAQQRRVMQAIEDCRTAALGGHLEACDHCGAEVARYHSCRNRHCPKCQTLARRSMIGQTVGIAATARTTAAGMSGTIVDTAVTASSFLPFKIVGISDFELGGRGGSADGNVEVVTNHQVTKVTRAF